MCEYCENEKVIFQENVFSGLSWVWCGPEFKIKEAEAMEYTLGVFIDRGYLRFTDLDESDCMDHGQKIKIDYCPFCGIKLKDLKAD